MGRVPHATLVIIFLLVLFSIISVRGVHGPGWVGLGDFFDPTQKFEFVGLVTQPNPNFFTTQPNPTQPNLGFGLGCQFFF